MELAEDFRLGIKLNRRLRYRGGCQMLAADPTISAVTFDQIAFWGSPDYWVDGWYLRNGLLVLPASAFFLIALLIWLLRTIDPDQQEKE